MQFADAAALTPDENWTDANKLWPVNVPITKIMASARTK
jgi:hypothetical protein